MTPSQELRTRAGMRLALDYSRREKTAEGGWPYTKVPHHFPESLVWASQGSAGHSNTSKLLGSHPSPKPCIPGTPR